MAVSVDGVRLQCDCIIGNSFCPPPYRTSWHWEDVHCQSHNEVHSGRYQNIDMYVHDLTDCLVFINSFSDTQYIDVSRYADQPIPVVKTLFRHWFNKAAWHRPSILVFDNLDKLLSAESEVNVLSGDRPQAADSTQHADSFRTRHVTEIFVSMYSSSARTTTQNTRGILLLATATSAAAIHPLVNSVHIFQDVVNLKPPDKNARRDVCD